MKTLRNKLDPVNHPDTGSETASLITIDQADIEDLKDQSMFARFLSVLPDSLIQRITCENRHDKEEKKRGNMSKYQDQSQTNPGKLNVDAWMVIKLATESLGYRTPSISLKSCIRLITT